MNYLGDVNVWVALATPGHLHHSIALNWFEKLEEKIYFCRVTQMGFLRLVTNAHVMDVSVVTPDRAWAALGAFLEDSRIGFIPEPVGLEQAWRAQTRGHRSGHNFWTDAYLAAFASAANLTMLTFDRGFASRKGLDVRILA